MLTVCKELKFCAAHRLMGYKGACSNFHGHNYKVLVTISRPSLDEQGMVTDFKNIKDLFETWLLANWDHGVLLNSADREIVSMFVARPQLKMWLFPDVNPTAEAMAQILFLQFESMMKATDLTLVSIKVYETETAFAEVNHV